MRTLAFEKYNCVDLSAAMEGKKEITISYWNTLDDISKWKQNVEHLAAQSLGRQRWYRRYDVKVLEVLREYQFEV